ncbi:MAG: sarcosine oxidase [Thermomicrobiales bacterium]|nr:sarcosine oxidase [Thermomicrobiales bacterium]
MYDVIVVGLGAMGSAASYHLSRRGLRVLGIEAFAPSHGKGSFHGESRVIRLAYWEHPDYVPLLKRAYALWDELAEESGTTVLERTGGLFIGEPDGMMIQGTLQSVREHNLKYELLDAETIRQTYPAFRHRETDVAIFEEPAGLLDIEERKAIYYKVQEILYDEVPWVVYMLYTPDHASWAYIHGIYVDGRGQLHLEGAWTEK